MRNDFKSDGKTGIGKTAFFHGRNAPPDSVEPSPSRLYPNTLSVCSHSLRLSKIFMNFSFLFHPLSLIHVGILMLLGTLIWPQAARFSGVISTDPSAAREAVEDLPGLKINAPFPTVPTAQL